MSLCAKEIRFQIDCSSALHGACPEDGVRKRTLGVQVQGSSGRAAQRPRNDIDNVYNKSARRQGAPLTLMASTFLNKNSRHLNNTRLS